MVTREMTASAPAPVTRTDTRILPLDGAAAADTFVPVASTVGLTPGPHPAGSAANAYRSTAEPPESPQTTFADLVADILPTLQLPVTVVPPYAEPALLDM